MVMILPTTYAQPNPEPLSAEEQQTLLYMREEEKLARDVYTAMFELWELPVFDNIRASEQRHMDALKRLIDKHDLVDPVVDDTPGVFANPELAALYTTLTTAGSVSSLEALMTGALIEEIDIVDLREALDETTHADLERVYGNLVRGSRNHLRAFVALIVDAGATYEPQHLTQDEFDNIVNSPMEPGNGKHHGRRGRGQGKGQCQGLGQGPGQGQCLGLGQGPGQGQCRGLGQGKGNGLGQGQASAKRQGLGRGQKQAKGPGQGRGRGQGPRADCPRLP
jgi:hypothetical protein